MEKNVVIEKQGEGESVIEKQGERCSVIEKHGERERILFNVVLRREAIIPISVILSHRRYGVHNEHIVSYTLYNQYLVHL